MKYLLAATISAVGLIGLNSALAKGGGNSSSNSAPPAPAHRGASAPVTTPVGGGVPHNLSGPGTYRPLTVYGNGQRTLVYPGVRNSAVHHPTNSNLVSSGAMQRTGGNLRSSSAVASVTKTKLDPQTSARLRNWKGNLSSTGQAHQNNANNHHHHHDHDWWKDRCLAFIFFDWGWWGWYDGWWYPAWGYDPYSYYEYNEPIYASNGLTPDQIVAGVQAKLQQLGYYTYAIDGKMGPLTRAALARYQRDHHMSITSGTDPTTLGSLGIIH